MTSCKHESGDYIQGNWVCAQCHRRLSERPVKYGLGIGTRGESRQDVVWMASIAIEEGVPYSKFVEWMVRYFLWRCQLTVTKDEALSQCLESLRDMGEPYGDDGCSWDKDDAKEIVKEGICLYWDESPTGAN